MTRVNLIPEEIRRQRSTRGWARRVRFVALCGLIAVGGLYGIRWYQAFTLGGEIRAIESERAATQERMASFQEVVDARAAVALAEQLVGDLSAGSISWSDQMLELARVVPPGFTLSSMTGSVSTGTAGIVGSVTFSATSRELVPTEVWLLRIAEQEGWANGWVTSVQAEGADYTVTGSFDLTSSLVVAREGVGA